MAVERYPPTADGIQYPAAIRQFQPWTVAGAHHPGRIMEGLLGKGVPQMGMPMGLCLLRLPGRASHGARRCEREPSSMIPP